MQSETLAVQLQLAIWRRVAKGRFDVPRVVGQRTQDHGSGSFGPDDSSARP